MPNITDTPCCGLKLVEGFGGDYTPSRDRLRGAMLNDRNNFSGLQVAAYGVVTNAQLANAQNAQMLFDDGWRTIARWKNINSSHYCNLLFNAQLEDPMNTTDLTVQESVLLQEQLNITVEVVAEAETQPQTARGELWELIRFRFDEDGIVDFAESIVLQAYDHEPGNLEIAEEIQAYKDSFNRTSTGRMRFGTRRVDQ